MAQLEKQNALLQGQLKQQQQTVDLDLQARCAVGAKAYFDEQWAGTEPTAILLSFMMSTGAMNTAVF